jgi:hypothetical protein
MENISQYDSGERCGPSACFYRGEYFKKFLRNQWARKADMRTSCCSKKGSLLKAWPPGMGWGYNRGKSFYMCLCKGNTFKGLLKNHWTIKGKIYMKAF